MEWKLAHNGSYRGTLYARGTHDPPHPLPFPRYFHTLTKISDSKEPSTYDVLKHFGTTGTILTSSFLSTYSLWLP